MTKSHLISLLGAVLMSTTVLQTSAQTAFSLAEEQANQNTPEGWEAVELPYNMPTITTANTFDITAYGATTSSADNTAAIQAALDAAASAGGGMVIVPAGTWMFGRIQIGSKTILHLSAGATLKLLSYADQPDHTTKTPYITNKNNASDIVVEGESKETSIIEGQGAAWWDAVEQGVSGLQRGSLIRFESGSRFLFRHFRMQNAPSTNLTLGNSGKGGNNTVHDLSIYAPASHGVADPSHNTDGIPIWSAYANIYNCDIDTGDDNVVTDSNAQYIHVWNCHFKAGHGASLGSYTVNMHDILYEDLTFEGTDCGFRLKSNRDRSGDVYNLTFRNCTMTGVMNPIQITAWYDKLPESPQAAAASPESVITTTPKFHDITFENVTATGYTGSASGKNGYGIFIYGRPESLVKNVAFKNVHIRQGGGMKLNFCEGVTFDEQCWYSKTSTGKTSTAAGITDVIDEQYQCSYTWNGMAPDVTVTDVVLSGSTYLSSAEDNSAYYFQNGYSITNESNKGYASGNSATIKYSKNVQYTIVIPSGKAVTAIAFTGYGNGSGTTTSSWLKEVNGTEYGETDYVFPKNSNKANFTTHSLSFSEAVSGTLTFTSGGNQSCFIITLTVEDATTGIEKTVQSSKFKVQSVYDLQGRKVAQPNSQFSILNSQLKKGLYIVNGKKILIK